MDDEKAPFFWLLVLSTCILSAQDYIPLVQEQATWIVHAYGESGQDIYRYRIEGDILIDNVAYKKVYRPHL